MNHIEKPAIDMLRHQNGEVLPLRPAALFVVPIFYGSNYVSFIRFAQHDLDLVHRIVFWVLEQYIEATAGILRAFLLQSFEFAKPKAGRIFVDLILKPIFIKTSFTDGELVCDLNIPRHGISS